MARTATDDLEHDSAEDRKVPLVRAKPGRKKKEQPVSTERGRAQAEKRRAIRQDMKDDRGLDDGPWMNTENSELYEGEI